MNSVVSVQRKKRRAEQYWSCPLFPDWRGVEFKTAERFYVGGVAGGDRDYRHSDRAVAAGGAGGAGSGAADAVHQ